jgi:hypothetical protein
MGTINFKANAHWPVKIRLVLWEIRGYIRGEVSRSSSGNSESVQKFIVALSFIFFTFLCPEKAVGTRWYCVVWMCYFWCIQLWKNELPTMAHKINDMQNRKQMLSLIIWWCFPNQMSSCGLLVLSWQTKRRLIYSLRVKTQNWFFKREMGQTNEQPHKFNECQSVSCMGSRFRSNQFKTSFYPPAIMECRLYFSVLS